MSERRLDTGSGFDAAQLVIRRAHREDAPAIADLMSEHPLWWERDCRDQSRAIARRLEDREYGLVAEYLDGSRKILAGFALVSDGTFSDHGYIRLIGTRQSLTGRGIGARLLLDVERLFRERGIERVFLLCTDSNTVAQAFYERHGYHRVGALPDWLQDGVGELIYVKRDLVADSG